MFREECLQASISSASASSISSLIRNRSDTGKYQTGSVRIRPEIELFKMADAEEIEVCKLVDIRSHRATPP